MTFYIRVWAKTVFKYVINNKKLCFCIKWLLLLIAAVGMTYLTFRDGLILVGQYEQKKTVASVVLKDHSDPGVPLPNGTMCIKFHDLSLLDYSNGSATLSHFEELLVKSIKLKRPDSLTYRLHRQGIDKKQIWKEVLSESFSAADREDFAKAEVELKKLLCKYLNLKFLMPNHRPDYMNMCQHINAGDISMTLNNYDLICFRIPLYLTPITAIKNELYDNKYKDLYTDIKYAQKGFELSLTPLYLQNVFPKLYARNKKISVIAYFPENRYSYRMETLQYSGENEFKDEIFYPQEFGYLQHAHQFVDVSIKSNYTRVNDKSCIDLYNNTYCTVRRLERDFTFVCKCRRFLTDYYEADVYHDHPHCDKSHYNKCQNQTEFNHTLVQKSEEDCDFCARLLYEHKVYSGFRKIPQDVEERYIEVFCEIYKTVYNKTDEECESFKENLNKGEDHLQLFTHLYNLTVTTNISNITDDEDRENFARFLLGDVTYTFAMNSLTYQEVTELLFISRESLLAYIGGIMNLYLGVSGLSAFFYVVKGIKWLKKYWQERKKKLERQYQMRLSMWQLLFLILLKRDYQQQLDHDGHATATPLLDQQQHSATGCRTKTIVIQRTRL